MISTREPSLPARQLAQHIAERYSAVDAIEAVVLSGSQTTGLGDDSSDIDLYVYSREAVLLEKRAQVAGGAAKAEIGNEFWEPGDEWVDAASGVSADVMFRRVGWIEDQLDRVLRRHQASVGYSTCFWYNVLHSRPLFDRNGWFRRLQKHASQPYPAALQRAIIAKNHPILRGNLSSYLHQIELAIARNDLLSLNHRTAALLASYFDIVFAVNELPHPGEKRLLQFAERDCAKRPRDMAPRVFALIAAVPALDTSLIAAANRLLDGLDELLQSTSLLPGSTGGPTGSQGAGSK
jgi:predicted nucleotidyltransferase